MAILLNLVKKKLRVAQTYLLRRENVALYFRYAQNPAQNFKITRANGA